MELHSRCSFPFPTQWKLLCATDLPFTQMIKAALSSITHGRTQYSCSGAQYFLTKTKACCRLEEKEIASCHTPSPSINQWDALQVLLKHCGIFFHWNILSPPLRSRERPLDFLLQVFVSDFSPVWFPDKVLLMHSVRETQQLLAPPWSPKEALLTLREACISASHLSNEMFELADLKVLRDKCW